LPVEQNEPLVVSVDRDGSYYLNIGEDPDTPVDAQTLVAKVAAVMRQKPATQVLVKGDEQVCITVERVTRCYQFERNSADLDLYRARDVTSDEWVEFRVTDGRAIVADEPKKMGNKGGAAAPSSAEIAAELSNPNTALASLTFKNQFRWFEGDLPNADDQRSYTLLSQPALPSPLENGDKIIWRPAIPFIVDQPIFDPEKLDFDVG